MKVMHIKIIKKTPNEGIAQIDKRLKYKMKVMHIKKKKQNTI